MELRTATKHIRFQMTIFCVHSTLPRNNNHVITLTELNAVQTDDFPQTTANPVADNGFAELLGDSVACPVMAEPVLTAVDDNTWTHCAFAASV